MADLNQREKTLLKLIVKREFFNCSECEKENDADSGHADHKLDIHATYNDIALWFAYLDWSLIGKGMDFIFLGYDTGNLQLVLNELVDEDFLTPMEYCGGCGGQVYVRTDTMKAPASVRLAEDGRMCRFA